MMRIVYGSLKMEIIRGAPSGEVHQFGVNVIIRSICTPWKIIFRGNTIFLRKLYLIWTSTGRFAIMKVGVFIIIAHLCRIISPKYIVINWFCPLIPFFIIDSPARFIIPIIEEVVIDRFAARTETFYIYTLMLRSGQCVEPDFRWRFITQAQALLIYIADDIIIYLILPRKSGHGVKTIGLV